MIGRLLSFVVKSQSRLAGDSSIVGDRQLPFVSEGFDPSSLAGQSSAPIRAQASSAIGKLLSFMRTGHCFVPEEMRRQLGL
jgi:hypothetical protein